MIDTSPLLPPVPAAARVAAAWLGSVPVEAAPVAGSGFSGAALVRVRPRDAATWHVLKAFAAGTPRGRVEWVHALALHLSAAGLAEVPAPRRTPTGDTVVSDPEDLWWELVPFVEGVATDAPTPDQAASALAVLARVHEAASALPGDWPRAGPSPGVMRRIAQARDLVARPWRLRRSRADRAGDDSLADAIGGRRERAIGLLETADGQRAVARLAAGRSARMRLQPVLRDVRGDHVIFAPDRSERVAGIVDLHAAGVDTPATDLARLFGSWRRHAPTASADPAAVWPEALAAYAGVRPLDPAERRLVPFLHAAGVICGLDNWFRWTLEERRSFAAPAAVVGRIDRLLDDLPAALEWLADLPPAEFDP